MKRNLLILFFIAIFTCNTVFAETWQTIKAGKKTIEIDTSNVFIDTNDFGQDLYLYWIKTKKEDGIYQSLLAACCSTRKIVILKTLKLNKTGKILSKKINNAPAFQAIQPNSGEEAAFNYIYNMDINKFQKCDTYIEMAQKNLDEHNFESARINALEVYNETVLLSKEGYSPMHIADALDLLARAYSGLGNNAEALKAWNAAISIAQKYTDNEFTQSLIVKRDIMQEFVNIGKKSSKTSK